jgi:RTX calcium-binding nonapeptide repeat (4 copies)
VRYVDAVECLLGGHRREVSPGKVASCESVCQGPCTVSSSASNTTISGTSGADLICVHGDGDTVRGLGGDDIIYGTGHRDTVRGGGGRHVLVVHGGNNVVRGGRNADTINVRTVSAVARSFTAAQASLSASQTALTACIAARASPHAPPIAPADAGPRRSGIPEPCLLGCLMAGYVAERRAER